MKQEHKVAKAYENLTKRGRYTAYDHFGQAKPERNKGVHEKLIVRNIRKKMVSDRTVLLTYYAFPSGRGLLILR